MAVMINVAIIPARGGSKGIPRKNVRLLNGKPLIAYVIETSKRAKNIDRVVVSTDDEEIASVSKQYGAEVIMRPTHLSTDEVPLDPVIEYTVKRIEENFKVNLVVTIQPTSPLLKTETLENILDKLQQENLDTILTAVDDRHLAWNKIENQFVPRYTKRVNRQYLPSEFRETGAVFATKREFVTENNRIGNNLSLFEVDKYESVDIDSPLDWWVAEKLLRRKKVLFRVDGYEEIGLGHIYRTLTLAHSIMDHDVSFLMNSKYELGIGIVQSYNFKVETFNGNSLEKVKDLQPDIVINDILDTNKDYILALKELGLTVYNFEDLGEGAEYADGVFNALYPGSVPSENFYTGEKFYCARSEFLLSDKKIISEEVKNVLITFGGTDPNNLTLKTLKSIKDVPGNFKITIILGPGYSKTEELNSFLGNVNREIMVYNKVKNMAEHMYKADLIFSSAGRTMYEIAMIGTPAIIISQNSREMTHLFGHNYNGFVNLGLHSDLTEKKVEDQFVKLIENVEIRKLMNKRMLMHDLKNGISRVLEIIFK
ncbi:cytidylyltransferase domain-containing protein [Fictibacillus halophilus]|uniref:cytidylyltransferase domain-containing protein n=1 Tax=Fictibacillus halophilus TaxID=1610490 RepID=UPI001CFA9477|nr:glycosyltransferase [Fictibacillus halophilus]